MLVKDQYEIPIKRLYIPCCFIVECDSCGKEHVVNFDMDYLSYPINNKWENGYVWCEACDSEFQYQRKLTLNVEVKPND